MSENQKDDTTPRAGIVTLFFPAVTARHRVVSGFRRANKPKIIAAA